MIYSFLYVLVFSCAAVLIQKLYLSISPFFSLLITAIIATLYFNVVNIGKLKTMYASCWQEKGLWFAIMVTILVMWNCSMITPGLIGSSMYNFLYFSWLGMSLCPVITAALQELVFRDVDLRYIVIYLLYTLIVGSSYFFKSRNLVNV